jgi:ABC-type multidrug transport system ATPase subunit
VLILDEPTTGVDAVSRKEFWEMLRRLKAKGITILVSTPYMDEAILCDRVALIQAGRFLKIAPPHTITEGFGKPLFAVKADRMFDLLHDLRSMPVATKVYPFGEYHHLILSQPGISVGQVSNFLTEKGHIRTSVRSIEPTIEDVFIDLMQTD